ncbi:MAG: NAD-dependent epimerase/dehydratase family protein [Actinomycetota bacterium]
MTSRTVAVTGVSGVLGQRLLALLDASSTLSDVIGIDLRDPARRARKLKFHRADVVNADLAPFLVGVDTVVHLAAIAGSILDEALMTRVNCDGTRRVLEAASRAGVTTFVRPSSATVYGAWPNNAVPLTEDVALRPNPGYLPAILDAECERCVVEWVGARTGRAAARLRIAPIVGAGAHSLFAANAAGHPPVVVRNAAAPVQVAHVDDAATALLHAVEQRLDGVFNVAADGWLAHEDAAALHPRRHLPGIPPEAAERILGVLWNSGLGEAPPTAVPYLIHPWVVANDRLKDTGWAPRHTNEEAILLWSPPPSSGALPWAAAVGAVVAGAVGATWWLTRRRRASRPTRG